MSLLVLLNGPAGPPAPASGVYTLPVGYVLRAGYPQGEETATRTFAIGDESGRISYVLGQV